MTNHPEIPAELLDAATSAVEKIVLSLKETGGCSTVELARTALEAADIPALLAERDGLRFVHGELSEATIKAQTEVRELRARVAELEKELIKVREVLHEQTTYLVDQLAQQEADSARLRFLINESGMDGFNGRDAIDFIEAVMRERGHDEWTKEDEFEGWRRLLDEAMAAERGEGE